MCGFWTCGFQTHLTDSDVKMLIFPWYFSVCLFLFCSVSRNIFRGSWFPHLVLSCGLFHTIYQAVFFLLSSLKCCNCLCTENMCCCGFSFSLSFWLCFVRCIFVMCRLVMAAKHPKIYRLSNRIELYFVWIWRLRLDTQSKMQFSHTFRLFRRRFSTSLHFSSSSAAAAVAFVRYFLVCIAILLCDGCNLFFF